MAVAENPPGIAGGFAPGEGVFYYPDHEFRLATRVLKCIIPVLAREFKQGQLTFDNMGRIIEIVTGNSIGSTQVGWKVVEALDKAELLSEAVRPGSDSDQHIEYVVAFPDQGISEDESSLFVRNDAPQSDSPRWSIERRPITPAK